MPKLNKRATGAELMDNFSLTYTDVVPVLKGLENMNALFGGHKTIIQALQTAGIKNGNIISDWGCGGGDTLRAIAKWAYKNNLQLQLKGIDASLPTLTFAREKAAGFKNIDFILSDVRMDKLLANQFDVVYSNLFTHHFNDAEWIALVKKMLYCSKKAVIINDLQRHWLLYIAVIAITHIFTKNKMARFDGPLSVQKSFKKTELVALLKQAGISNYKINWKWIFRWQVIIYK